MELKVAGERSDLVVGAAQEIVTAVDGAVADLPVNDRTQRVRIGEQPAALPDQKILVVHMAMASDAAADIAFDEQLPGRLDASEKFAGIGLRVLEGETRDARNRGNWRERKEAEILAVLTEAAEITAAAFEGPSGCGNRYRRLGERRIRNI